MLVGKLDKKNESIVPLLEELKPFGEKRLDSDDLGILVIYTI